MKLHWDEDIYGIEPFRWNMKITKEKFLKNRDLKLYLDIFHGWLIGMQTLAQKQLKKQWKYWCPL